MKFYVQISVDSLRNTTKIPGVFGLEAETLVTRSHYNAKKTLLRNFVVGISKMTATRGKAYL
jgi:hypothetical protein